MKSIYSFLLGMLMISISAHSQFSYPPSLAQNVTGTYTDLGTSGSAISTANFDDANSAPIPIGFSFNFNGANHTHFILNTNGFIKVGSSTMPAPSSAALFYSAGNSYTNGIFNSTSILDANLISAMNHDFEAAGPTTEYRTETSGPAGSQVCTIQFKNIKDKTTTPVVQYDSINFQIKLYEGTNVIEFIYGPFFSSTNASAFKSSACGLKGGNVNDITAATKGSTQAWDAATFISGNYTGNAFNFGNDVAPGRPMPDNGRTLRFTPAFADDLGITAIHSLGVLPIPYALPHTIGIPITNQGINNATGIKIYVDISGANTFKDTITLSTLASGTSFTANVTGFTPTNMGVNIIKAYVDADDNIDNDTTTLRQVVTDNIFSYADTTLRPLPTAGLGYNMGTGLILNKYKVNGKRYVTGADIFLMPDALGNDFYAVVMDLAGTIVSQTQVQTGTAADTMTYVHFDFPTPVLFNNTDFYVGLAQMANLTAGWFPQATVPENPMRTGAYYSTGIGGSATPTDAQTLNLSINPQPLIQGHIAGNDIIIDNFSGVPPFKCPSSNESIGIIVQNKDSTLIDFNVDTLTISVTTTTPIAQTFSAEVNTGTLAPGAKLNVPITSAFDFSTPGTYTLRVRSSMTLEVDTNNNKKNFDVIVIPANPSVDIAVWPSDEECYGDSLAFIALPITGGSMSYQWKVDGVNVGAVTTDSIFSPVNLLSSAVSVDLITEDCSANPLTVSSSDLDMEVNPSPISLAGKDTVIENSTESYFFSPRPLSTINWTVTGGTPDNTTGNRVDIDWGAATKGKIVISEMDENGCEYTTEIDIEVLSIVGYNKLNNGGFTIGEPFPNPSNGLSNIEIYAPKETNVSVSLFSTTGKKVADVYNGTVNGQKVIQFNTEELPAGIYYYEMNAEEFRLTKKITVL